MPKISRPLSPSCARFDRASSGECRELNNAEFTVEGRVSARADCNRCSASYSSTGANLEIGALTCTRAYCGDESLFDEYAGALDGATSFERSGASLVIRYAGGSLRFADNP